MAFNLNMLKSLFSKLKPAAKAIAPVTDDVAKAVTNYGDDVAGLIASQGDDAINAASKISGRPYRYGIDTTGKVWQQFDDTPNEIFINDKAFHMPDFSSLNTGREISNARTKERLLNKRMRPVGNPSKSTAIGDKLSTLYDDMYGSGHLAASGMVPEDWLDTPYTDRFGNEVMIDSHFPEQWSYRLTPQEQRLGDLVERRGYMPSWNMHLDPETGREFPVPIDYRFSDLLPNEPNNIPASVYTDVDAPSRITNDAFGSRNIRGFEPDVPISKAAYQAYSPLFEDSPYFPDGFASPDDFARYYDSLELGYTPIEFGWDSYNESFSDTVDSNDWNDFWRSFHGQYPYDDEGPLEAFFREQRKLPKGITKQPPNRRVEEFFSNPMFQDDSWIK